LGAANRVVNSIIYNFMAKESIELHPIIQRNDHTAWLEILMLGERFHPHAWIEDQKWGPSYKTAPRFGGPDTLSFDGGPYTTNEEYGPLVVALADLIVPHNVRVLGVRQDYLNPYFNPIAFREGVDAGPYEYCGPRFVKAVAGVISDVTDRHVEIAGDPQAFVSLDMYHSFTDFGVNAFTRGNLPPIAED
jgi:hypothetical protein